HREGQPGVHRRRRQDREGRVQGPRGRRTDDAAREARSGRLQGQPGDARQACDASRPDPAGHDADPDTVGAAGDHRAWKVSMRASRSTLAYVIVGTALVGSGVASADDELAKKLAAYEIDARNIATDLPRPDQTSPATGVRKLVDAEVAYATGDYD